MLLHAHYARTDRKDMAFFYNCKIFRRNYLRNRLIFNCCDRVAESKLCGETLKVCEKCVILSDNRLLVA